MGGMYNSIQEDHPMEIRTKTLGCEVWPYVVCSAKQMKRV